MIKFIAAALWLCAVTGGSIFYAFSASAPKAKLPENEPGYLGGLEYIKADMVSVPDIREAQVEGYFLARMQYTADPELLKKLIVPVQMLLLDQSYTYIYTHPVIDVRKPEAFDTEKLKASLKETINAKVGGKLIHDILIEQIDYIPKSEIRDNALRRRLGPTKFLTTGVAEEGTAAPKGEAAKAPAPKPAH